MKKIWNEGRILGMSAYELFVRELLSDNPEATVPSEKEWLSSTLGNGNTMLLKIPSRTSAGWHDYELPSTSFLAAVSTIVGSVFVGNADFEGNWAVRVTDYGDLISNTSSSSPTTGGSVPAKIPATIQDSQFVLNEEFKQICTEYAKIVEGICYQGGTWSNYNQHGVAKEFTPDPSKPGYVRIRLSKATTHDTFVLLQGFLSKDVLKGMTGFESGMDTPLPEDGDFLGPMSWPWAVKIVFGYSAEVQTVVNKLSYSRKLPSNAAEKQVDSKAIIDFTSTNPNTYYTSNYTTSNVDINVTDLNVSGVEGASILAAYQKSANYAPGLYAAKVTAEGAQKLSPIDSHAPGTIRVFKNRPLAVQYPSAVHNVYGVYQNENNTLHMFDENGADINLNSKVAVSRTASGSYSRYPTNQTTDAGARTATAQGYDYYTTSTQSGDETILNPSLSSAVNASAFNTTGSASVDIVDTFNWAMLMSVLAGNRSIGTIRDDLKKFRDNHLANMISKNYLNDLGTVENYITFSGDGSTGRRLYISDSAPSGARVGDIGIGW